MKGLTLQCELLKLTAIKVSEKDIEKASKCECGISEGNDDGVYTSWKSECIFLCPSECRDRCVWRWLRVPLGMQRVCPQGGAQWGRHHSVVPRLGEAGLLSSGLLKP